MTDLGPLDRCPYSKKGAHHLAAIIPGDDDHDVTFYCEWCGALRRLPATGALTSSLDDLDPLTIARLVEGA